MAVFKSLKTVAEFRRNEHGLYDITKATHVDSAILEYEFTRAGDILLSGLIKDKSEAKASYGVRKFFAIVFWLFFGVFLTFRLHFPIDSQSSCSQNHSRLRSVSGWRARQPHT